MASESEQFKGSRAPGRWADALVPRSGWECVYVEDLGVVAAVCGMCQAKDIRYVHTMKHRGFAETIDAGCICAGRMEGNLLLAARREQGVSNRTKRRLNWLKRKWRISHAGNDFLKIKGRVVVVFRSGDLWRGMVKDCATESTARTGYLDTSDEAKLAAFDLLTRSDIILPTTNASRGLGA